MEVLVSIKNINELKNYQNVKAIITGGDFSFKYNNSIEGLKEINEYCLDNNIKLYLSLDVLVGEDELNDLNNYLDELIKLNISGIYYADFAVAVKLKDRNIKLIYDPSSLNTNTNDIKFYLDLNQDCMAARELTLEEIKYIVDKYPCRIDIQCFGHLRMSYSKRKFLTNYFKEINSDFNPVDKDNLTLVEESRNYKLPVKENKYGTCIYSDYVLLMYEELNSLKNNLNRVIIDSDFISNDIIQDVINDLNDLDNAKEEKIINKYSDVEFSKAYLYQKTVDKKENE